VVTPPNLLKLFGGVTVIAFENLSRTASLCGFQKSLEFLSLCDHINSLMTIVLLDCLFTSHL
jgi:16S rRNA G966 N2-methylase RsmD